MQQGASLTMHTQKTKREIVSGDTGDTQVWANPTFVESFVSKSLSMTGTLWIQAQDTLKKRISFLEQSTNILHKK